MTASATVHANSGSESSNPFIGFLADLDYERVSLFDD